MATLLRPDPTFYPSPRLASEAPAEALAYMVTFDPTGQAPDALLTIDVLRDGWTRVQIPAGLMVRDAALDGRRVSLVAGMQPHVLLPRAGRSVLAHLIAFEHDGTISADGPVGASATYALKR